MRWWVALVILVAIGLGIWARIVTFDPLSLVTIVVLLWNNNVMMERQQQTADVIKKSHEIVTANQKAILENLKRITIQVKSK